MKRFAGDMFNDQAQQLITGVAVIEPFTWREMRFEVIFCPLDGFLWCPEVRRVFKDKVLGIKKSARQKKAAGVHDGAPSPGEL